MKAIQLTLFALLFSLTLCFSQDTITLRTGIEIAGRVMEVGQAEVRYKRIDNLTGPVYLLPMESVAAIRYENGTKDTFQIPEESINPQPPVKRNITSYVKGQRDASKYYKGYKAAATGTMVVSLISPFMGLIPAITCSSVTPGDPRLNCPDTNLLQDIDYHKGYTRKAKKIKAGHVWKSWAIGLGFNIGLFLVLNL